MTTLPEYTVSGLSKALKSAVEKAFPRVRLRGEITGYRGPHGSGHAYFSLKDENGRLDAIIWRGVLNRLEIQPENGLEVVATGKITTFPQQSRYQIIIDTLEMAGVGALMALLEKRKKMLAAEGLFDASRKKKLPFLPSVIGVVTSPQGAVIRDILHRISDRFPLHVIIWPVRVQGASAAQEIAAAIEGFAALPACFPSPDVLIVARGGGSLEDLWCFNEECVVRAAARSPIPLVSAIGHETDWTLIDYVSDLRAPTPTGAAEMVVPVRMDLVLDLEKLALRLKQASQRGLSSRKTELRACYLALPSKRDILSHARQRYDFLVTTLRQTQEKNLREHSQKAERLFQKLSPFFLVNMCAAHKNTYHICALRLRHARKTLFEKAENTLELFSRERLFYPVQQRMQHARCRAEQTGATFGAATKTSLETRRKHLEVHHKMLAALSYKASLRRGFCVLRDARNRILTRAHQARARDALSLELYDGTLQVSAHQEGKIRKRQSKAARKKTVSVAPREKQLSLF